MTFPGVGRRAPKPTGLTGQSRSPTSHFSARKRFPADSDDNAPLKSKATGSQRLAGGPGSSGHPHPNPSLGAPKARLNDGE